MTKATPLEKLDRKHFAKTSAAAKTPAELEKLRKSAKDIALLEAKVRSAILEVFDGTTMLRWGEMVKGDEDNILEANVRSAISKIFDRSSVLCLGKYGMGK